MLTGLRASDAPTLTRLCGADQKVFLRIGALLQAQLALTEAALSELLGQERGKILLLDRRLKDADPARFTALLDEHQLNSDVVLVDGAETEAGWRVIALADEVGNPLLAAANDTSEPGDVRPGGALALRVATLAPAIRVPVEGLLQANGDEARAAALEQLRYASPPLEVVGELMPLLLADAAELVRERAVGLLVSAGAHVTIIDLVRALQRDDLVALARLAPTLPTLPAIQRDLACVALMAAVGRGQAHQILVDSCTHLAGHLAGHSGLDRLLELLLPCPLNLVHLVRAVQTHDAERVRSILERALGGSPEGDRHIIILLAGPDQQGDDRLIERGIDLLLSPESAPVERMALASALSRLAGRSGLGQRLVGRGLDLAKSYETSVYWLLAELARDGVLDAQTSTTLARLLRRLLREAPSNHLAAILDYQLVAVVAAGDDDRRALVEPLAETLVRYRDDRTHDLIQHALRTIGAPAIAPLWDMLDEQPNVQVRILAAETLGDLILAGSPSTVDIDRLLTRAGRVDSSQAGDAERASVLTTAARLAAALAGDPEPARRVDALCQRAGDSGIAALGWLAASPHLDPVRRSAILEWMLGGIAQDLPDSPLERSTDATTDIVTFVIDAELGRHTEQVPILLQALERMGASEHLPAPLLRHLVDRLCAQWKRVSGWEIMWGPGNTRELGRMLGALAERPSFPVNLRVRICEALLPRVSQLHVARSVAAIVATGEAGYLADLAGRAAARLLALIQRGQFAEDENEDLADVVAAFLMVSDLGEDSNAVRRRLAAQLTALKSHLPQRARQHLRDKLPTLDGTIRERLDWL